jgi:hypothetical protein
MTRGLLRTSPIVCGLGVGLLVLGVTGRQSSGLIIGPVALVLDGGGVIEWLREIRRPRAAAAREDK